MLCWAGLGWAGLGCVVCERSGLGCQLESERREVKKQGQGDIGVW